MLLQFVNGDEIEVEVLGTFDVDGKEYAALANLENDETYLYRYIALDDEDFKFEEIPDEDFERVVEEFDAIMLEEN